MGTSEALQGDALRAFAVFARHRNFTSAAAELLISQPSLHVKINKLARTLGVPLYRRQGRGLVLTPRVGAWQPSPTTSAGRSRTTCRSCPATRRPSPSPPVAAPFAG